MKKLLRPLAILLALVLMLSMTVVAADGDPTVTEKSEYLGADQVRDTADDIVTAKFNGTNEFESLTVTYKVGAANVGMTYLCWLLAMDAEGKLIPPTESNVGDVVLDLKDANAVATADSNGLVTFSNVIPKTDSIVSCAIAISGMNGMELVKVGEIKVPYIPGDVDMSGTVDVGDATMLLRYLAGLVDDLSTINLKAADTDGSGSVDVGDGTTLLRTLAGLPTE